MIAEPTLRIVFESGGRNISLRAEMRVFFEHLNSRLDYIQKLQQQQKEGRESL
jgi:hypothetical protein